MGNVKNVETLEFWQAVKADFLAEEGHVPLFCYRSPAFSEAWDDSLSQLKIISFATAFLMGTAYGENLTIGTSYLFARKNWWELNNLNGKFQVKVRIDFADYMIKKFSNTNN